MIGKLYVSSSQLYIHMCFKDEKQKSCPLSKRTSWLFHSVYMFNKVFSHCFIFPEKHKYDVRILGCSPSELIIVGAGQYYLLVRS